MEEIYLVYVTTADKEEAEAIANKAITKRLAACANILDNVRSMYWWEGSIKRDSEAILFLKTIRDNMDDLEKEIKQNHSYSNPCIIFIPIDRISGDFKKWVIKETSKDRDG